MLRGCFYKAVFFVCISFINWLFEITELFSLSNAIKFKFICLVYLTAEIMLELLIMTFQVKTRLQKTTRNTYLQKCLRLELNQ